MHTAHPILQPFLDYLKFEKRYSKHTLLSYQNDLTAFFDYVIVQYGETPLKDISHMYIRSWLASLKDAGLASKSINRKISSLKSFYKFQIRTGVLKQSPMARIIAPKNESRLPAFVADKDIKTLFEHVEFSEGRQGETERLLMLMLYQTGMRLGELIHIKYQQVDVSNKSLKILGKGNKERIIPISGELLTEIKAYRKGEEQQTELLFLNQKGKPFSPRAVYTIVRKYLSLVTTVDKKSPHVLRHSFATHLTNNGADLNAVKELLGHSSLASTQVYTHNSIEKLKNIHKKAHPRA
ncbi:MAG: tyrosine-type recombinase/integrase [Flavisolibacter sp.]